MPRSAHTARMALAALRAAGHASREATTAELDLVEKLRSEQASVDLVERTIRNLRSRQTLDIVAHGDEIFQAVRSRRKWPGAA